MELSAFETCLTSAGDRVHGLVIFGQRTDSLPFNLKKKNNNSGQEEGSYRAKTDSSIEHSVTLSAVFLFAEKPNACCGGIKL